MDPIRSICSRTCSGAMPGRCTRRLSASAPTRRARWRRAVPPLSGSSRSRSGRRRQVRGGVALVDRPLAVDQLGSARGPATPGGSGPWARPPASSKARVRRAEPLRRRHALHAGCPPRTAAARRGGGAPTRPREHRAPVPAARAQGGVPGERAQVLAAEHGHQPGELRLEPTDGARPGRPRRLEVERQSARRPRPGRPGRGGGPPARPPPRPPGRWSAAGSSRGAAAAHPLARSSRTKDAICRGCAM